MTLKTLEHEGINAHVGSNEVHLPEGLVGLPMLQNMEIVFTGDHLPFMWLRDKGDSDLSFLIIEPKSFLTDYRIELSDSDADFLGIESLDDVLILNIVTVHPGAMAKVTVNLVGPLVINRTTGLAKQVLIENCSEYSTRHPIHAAAQPRMNYACSL